MDFEEWLEAVDREINRLISLDHFDLAEQPWLEWHHKGVSAYDAAHMALKADGWED